MRTLLFILLAFLTVQTLHAQRTRTVNPKLNYKHAKVKNPKINPLLLKPDLVILPNVDLVQQNGNRYLYVRVKNVGKLRSIPNNMELRISWRIDYESFTNVTRIQNYNVKSLNPGQTKTFCIPVDDEDIHSNEGWGSSSATFRFWADSGQTVHEIREDNNQRVKSVPIIHD